MTTENENTGGKRLNSQRRIFVKEYLKCKNATKSAIKAGYSPKTAQEQSSRLLSNVMVKEEIEKGMQRIEAKLQIEAEDIAKELKNHAYFDLSDVMKIKGRVIRFKDFEKLPVEIRRCVQSVESTDKGLKVKFVDKQNALKLLGQYKGMFVEKIEHSGYLTSITDLVKHATKK